MSILFFPLFLFGRNLFYDKPPIYLWFLITIAPSLLFLIGLTLDWRRYEKKYQLYLKNQPAWLVQIPLIRGKIFVYGKKEK